MTDRYGGDVLGGDWRRPPRGRSVELPAEPGTVVEDVETGEQILVDSSDPLFRSRFADGVDERQSELEAGMRRGRVPLHRIDTSTDLVDALLSVITETQRRRA